MKALYHAPRLLNHTRCTSGRNITNTAVNSKPRNPLLFSEAAGHVAELLVGDKSVTRIPRTSSPESRRSAALLSRRLQTRMAVSASADATRRMNANKDHLLQSLRVSAEEASTTPSQIKRKAKKARKAAVAAACTADNSSTIVKLEYPLKSVPSKLQNDMQIESGWKAEDWGVDALVPPQTSDTEGEKSVEKTRVTPPHMRLPPIAYTRRLEGLLQDTTKAVLEDLTPPTEHRPIATLAHGLDRVLFNPGVHWLQDPRSKVYNFPTWLESIPKVTDFAFDRIASFIKSSRDEDLWTLAKREDRLFAGSTSSLSGILSHIYFLISHGRSVDTSTLSRHFEHEPKNFTPGQRMPASIVMKHNDGVYAVDSDSSTPSDKNILTWMGTLLEKFLTTSPEEFSRLMRDSPPAGEDPDTRREAYRYSKSEKFVMRSQLDCVDARLPGTGVFDIKTRAAVPIRMDLLNYEENSGYLIRTLHGPLESFEKEYYDLIRSAFLKYSFQARIGNMDGVLVAYHNTDRIFGFQYIPLDEMDERLFGAAGRGNAVFEKCIGILETVTSEVIIAFPHQSVKCTFETLESSGLMNVWIEPAEWDESQGPRPIVELDVTAASYIGGQEVRGARAISCSGDGWAIHWTISKSSSSFEDIRVRFDAAKERQFRAYSLPTGVSLANMADRWESMNFGGGQRDPSETTPYDPSRFRKANENVKQLRKLARVGRADTKQMALENEGIAKVVWGEHEDFAEESEMTAGMEPASALETTHEEFSNSYPGDSSAVVQTDNVEPELFSESQDLSHLGEESVVSDQRQDNGSYGGTETTQDEDIQPMSEAAPLPAPMLRSSNHLIESQSSDESHLNTRSPRAGSPNELVEQMLTGQALEDVPPIRKEDLLPSTSTTSGLSEPPIPITADVQKSGAIRPPSTIWKAG